MDYGVTRGIKSISKTRFGTLYYSALSIQDNYYAIGDLCKQKIITVPEVNHLFIPGGLAATQFYCSLQQLTALLAPIAKSITCLESTHSTVSDVYLFWLAVTAEIHKMLSDDGLPNSVKEFIRRTVNYRFNQMVNDAPSDVYITGFILDPRKCYLIFRVSLLSIFFTGFRFADIFHDLNPLAIKRLKIPPRNIDGTLDVTNAQPAETRIPQSLVRTGTFLLGLLRSEYKNLNRQIAGLNICDTNVRLKEQIISYQKGLYPFNRTLQSQDTAKDWWKRLNSCPSGDPQPLAVRFSIIICTVTNFYTETRPEYF